MQKALNEKGGTGTHSPTLDAAGLNNTYNMVLIIAIQTSSGLNEAYEQAIADHLKSLWLNPVNRPYIQELIDESGSEGVNNNTFDKCAGLILNSKIMEPAST